MAGHRGDRRGARLELLAARVGRARLPGPGGWRGRTAARPRDPDHPWPGDALDFWRVEAIEPGHLLRLRAEMKLPGLAWLELSPGERAGQTVYRQRALFHSRGLACHLSWHALLSLHAIVFGGTARNITRVAQHTGRSPSVRG